MRQNEVAADRQEALLRLRPESADLIDELLRRFKMSVHGGRKNFNPRAVIDWSMLEGGCRLTGDGPLADLEAAHLSITLICQAVRGHMPIPRRSHRCPWHRLSQLHPLQRHGCFLYPPSCARRSGRDGRP